MGNDDGVSQVVGSGKTDLNALTTETSIAQGDYVAMVDITDSVSGKITFSNLEDEIFGNVSGDATIAAGGALNQVSSSRCLLLVRFANAILYDCERYPFKIESDKLASEYCCIHFMPRDAK